MRAWQLIENVNGNFYVGDLYIVAVWDEKAICLHNNEITTLSRNDGERLIAENGLTLGGQLVEEPEGYYVGGLDLNALALNTKARGPTTIKFIVWPSDTHRGFSSQWITTFHLKPLNEAPIVDYQVGNINPSDEYFAPADQKIVQHPKFIERVKKAFAKIPFNFRFSFQSIDYPDRLVNYGRRNWDGDPKAITVVFSGNFGANLVPFTPWIVAHRLAHALFAEHEHFSQEIVNFLEDINDRCNKQLQKGEIWVWMHPMDIAYALGSTRASRKKKLNGIGEFPVEALTQFMITGKITFNTIPVSYISNYFNPNGDHERHEDVGDEQFVRELNKFIKGSEIKFEYEALKVLQDSVGKVFLI